MSVSFVLDSSCSSTLRWWYGTMWIIAVQGHARSHKDCKVLNKIAGEQIEARYENSTPESSDRAWVKRFSRRFIWLMKSINQVVAVIERPFKSGNASQSQRTAKQSVDLQLEICRRENSHTLLFANNNFVSFRVFTVRQCGSMSDSAATKPSRRFRIHLSEWYLFRSIKSSFVAFLQSESLQASFETENTKQVTTNHCSSSPNTSAARRVAEFIKRNDKRTVSWLFYSTSNHESEIYWRHCYSSFGS